MRYRAKAKCDNTAGKSLQDGCLLFLVEYVDPVSLERH